MQELDNGKKQLAPAAPESHLLQPLPIIEVDAQDDDPDIIFEKAIQDQHPRIPQTVACASKVG